MSNFVDDSTSHKVSELKMQNQNLGRGVDIFKESNHTLIKSVIDLHARQLSVVWRPSNIIQFTDT